MSYAIQNFWEFKKISVTPRFKLFFLLNNLSILFIFIKFNFFNSLYNFQLLNMFKVNFFFIKFFFSNFIFKLINTLNLNLIGGYSNNLFKSSVYQILKNLIQFLNGTKTELKHNSLNDNTNFNYYWCPVKISHFKFNKSLSKNIFFFNIIIFSFIWYQHTRYLNFYLNFIFLNFSLKLLKFYGGYFFKIYNF